MLTYQNRKRRKTQNNKVRMTSNFAPRKCKVITSFISGWRKTMEDADIHCCDMGDGNAIFGIFDGHGGR